MLNHTFPDNRKAISGWSVLVPTDGHTILVTVALRDDGTFWQLNRNTASGVFIGGGWEQLPAIPQGGAR